MRSDKRKFFSILFAFLLVWLAIRFFLPLFSPFLLGTLLALAAEPMVAFLQKRLRLPRGISAGIGVSLAFTQLSLFVLCLC